VTPSRVWLSWLAANVIPSMVVSILLLLVRGALGTDRSAIVAYIVLFVLVAVLQARVWARWRAARGGSSVRARRWTAWTLIGLVAAMFFGVGTVATLDGLGHERLGLVAGWAIAGLVLGVAQAMSLAVSARAAAWWVVATIAGWAGAAAAYSTFAAATAPLVNAPVLRWLVGGLAIEGNIELAITAVTFAIYGASTGVVLASLTPRAAAAVQ